MRPLPADPVAQLHAEYHGELLAFARERLGNRAPEAEDLLQEVWSAFARTSAAGPIEQPRAWLYRALRNRLTDHYRRRRTRPGIVALDDDLGVDGEDSVDPMLALAVDVQTSLLDDRDGDFWSLVEAALDTLPPAQRETFARNVIDGETLREIADDLGVPIGTAISRKRYARERLRAQLRDLYEDFFGSD